MSRNKHSPRACLPHQALNAARGIFFHRSFFSQFLFFSFLFLPPSSPFSLFSNFCATSRESRETTRLFTLCARISALLSLSWFRVICTTFSSHNCVSKLFIKRKRGGEGGGRRERERERSENLLSIFLGTRETRRGVKRRGWRKGGRGNIRLFVKEVESPCWWRKMLADIKGSDDGSAESLSICRGTEVAAASSRRPQKCS